MSLEFKPFTTNDYECLLPYFLQRPAYTCESHFLYHVIWRDFYNSQFSLTSNGVLWLINDGNKLAALPPTTDKDNYNNSFLQLQDYFTNELQEKLKLYLLDKEALDLLELDETKYKVNESRNSFDYIYDGDKLRELSGRKYNKKRNHINYFLRNYEGKFEYRTLTAQDKDNIIEFIGRWGINSNGNSPDKRITSEEVGIRDILDNYHVLSNITNMAGIYISGQLEAFTIGSYDPILKIAVIHTEKANPNIRGLYQYINQQFLVNEFADAVYINREDDMGIPSLRKAKESYYPTTLVKKYTINEI